MSSVAGAVSVLLLIFVSLVGLCNSRTLASTIVAMTAWLVLKAYSFLSAKTLATLSVWFAKANAS